MASNFKHYRELLEELGMTQRGASRFLDMGERTSRRWATDPDAEVPLAVIMLFEVMVKYKLDPYALRKLAGKPERKGVDYSDQRVAED